MSPNFLHTVRLLILMVTVSCVRRTPAPSAELRACDASSLRRWPIAAPGTRSLRVWLDAASQEYDGWRSYGWRRLRVAMDEWNKVRLPVRFVAAVSERDADVIVDVVRSLPVSDPVENNQAGVTSLTHLPDGTILRARVFIATAAPNGIRYRVLDQQGNLLHELGHALGLFHAVEKDAVMAPLRLGDALTRADMRLARQLYAGCTT